MTKRALIDVDSFVWRASMKGERTVQLDGDVWTTVAYLNEATDEFDYRIEEVRRELGVDSVVLAFTSTDNWRNDVYPAYKANRKDTKKPGLLQPVKQHARENFICRIVPRLEADDIVGILATIPRPSVPRENIIVSIDKDLRSVPGKLYNPDKKTFETVTVEQADYNHLVQTLAGDPQDGYPGIPGVGVKTAMKMLDKDGPTWSTVVAAYEKAGLTEADALTMARVARICRASEFDFINQVVRPWTPKDNQ